MTDEAPDKRPGTTTSDSQKGEIRAVSQVREGSRAQWPRTVPAATGFAQVRWVRAEIVEASDPSEQNTPVKNEDVGLPRVMRVTSAPGRGGFVHAPVCTSPVDRPANASGAQPGIELLDSADATNASKSPKMQRNSKGWLRRTIKKTGKALALVIAIWFVAMFALIGLFRSVNPPASALMVLRAASGTSLRHTWVDLNSISPNLVRAVIVSEDGRFCRHWGIDLKEVEAAIERANGGTPRGASTISMQVAKNLFLWPDKSYIRKALEVPLTLGIEAMWPKRRIAEVYLNIAEWGPGLFGAEAAARHHFGRSARQLDSRQAALMAAALPNPIRRQAGKPGRTTSRLARRLQSRVNRSRWAANCVLGPGRQ